MVSAVISFAIVIFVVGIVAGVVATVSIGIHREERYLRADQRAQHEIMYDVRGGPDGFLPESAPDRLAMGVRRLSGLTVRRPLIPAREDVDRDLLV